MIAQESIEEVYATAQVEDVVNEFVNLKKSGSNLKGLCPFHNEKTPSFMVSPSKNIYKCFGCGKGGNPVQFVMEHEGFTYPDAIRFLADKYGIKLIETKQSDEAHAEAMVKDSLFLVNDYAAEYFSNNLLQKDEGKAVGLSYFKQRGYREGTIEKFQLGFAVRDRKDLLKTATEAGYKEDQLQQLGLISQKGNDFFNDRVMFPIHNLSGKIIAFAGRTLSKDKKVPKYINSPESEIYEKRKTLYGLHLAKTEIRKKEECLLVEGYTDVITLHQAGIENVIASSGTSLTQNQVSLVKRYANTIVVLYDGDQAGILAAIRGVDIILEQDLDVKIVMLPDGEDPDSYLQRVGSTDFQKYIADQGKDFIFFKLALLQEEVGNDPIKKTKMVKSIVNSLARIPDQLKRSVYIKECSKLLDVEEEILITEANKSISSLLKEKDIERKRQSRQYQATPQEPNQTLIPTTQKKVLDQSTDYYQEKDLVRIVISSGHEIFNKEDDVTIGEFLTSNVHDILELFDEPTFQKILSEYISKISAGTTLDSTYFINHQDPIVSKIAVDVLTSPYSYANWEGKQLPLQTQPMPENNYVKDCLSAIFRIKERKLKKSKATIEGRLRNMEDHNSDEYYVLIKGYQKIKGHLSDIQAKQGTVVPTK